MKCLNNLLALCAFFLTIPTPSLAHTTERVSVSSDGVQGNKHSQYPSISDDGRYVAFQSDANNLIAADTNGKTDVFVHDRQTEVTERVSVANDGTQANGRSSLPKISADGRYVAFSSDASNLVANDTNNTSDVFIHDRQTGETERVSVASDGTQGNRYSGVSDISEDGRYVLFSSDATNLVANKTNVPYWDSYVHDRYTGVTERVSIASDGTQGNQHGDPWSISGDGRYVGFFSLATNLVANDTNNTYDVFVHDRQTGETERVSVASDGSETNPNSISYMPSLSGDGRYVAFLSNAINLVASDTNGTYDAFVHDRQTGETARVSVASDGTQANGYSNNPIISSDGRYVVYSSVANNLLVGKPNPVIGGVFIFDRQTGETDLVSIASNGTQGNAGGGADATISADGRYVAYWSNANNLVPNDTNGFADIYVTTRFVPNAAPIVILPGSASLHKGETFTASGTIDDQDSTAWTGTLDYGDGSAAVNLIISAGGSFSLSHVYSASGVYTVSVEVTDDEGASSQATLQVEVTNRVPVANAGSAKTLECTGGSTAVTLDGSASFDPDGDPLSYSWLGPFGTLSGATVSVWLGLANVTLTVTDNEGAADSDQALIAVEDTTPPTLTTGGNQTLEATSATGAAYALMPSSSDVCSAVNLTVSPELAVFPIGSTPVLLTATDAAGNSASEAITVTVVDTTPPLVTAPASVTVTASAPLTLVDIGMATATDAVGVASLSNDAPVAGFDVGDWIVIWTATDAAGNVGTATQQVSVLNAEPAVAIPSTMSLVEGGQLSSSGSFSDPNSTTWTGTVNFGDGTGDQPLLIQPDHTFALSHTYLDDGLYTVVVSILDNHGGTGSASLSVTVENAAPVLGEVSIDLPLHQLGNEIRLTALFSDAGALDTHTAVIDWGDATTSPATVGEANGSGTASGYHTYAAPGVYVVTVTVADDDGDAASAMYSYIVVYDPNGGFVTGGGYIQSPAGAYTLNPSLTGKASFGFSAKYKKGQSTPDGETQFRFQAGSLNFHSLAYDWLVVAGARAQYKGIGEINGAGGYGFMLTAIDGNLNGGGGTDQFRIKIWDLVGGEVIYDNRLGSADNTNGLTVLSGGSIVIHTAK
jgi:Tol biopolymer transport system component